MRAPGPRSRSPRASASSTEVTSWLPLLSTLPSTSLMFELCFLALVRKVARSSKDAFTFSCLVLAQGGWMLVASFFHSACCIVSEKLCRCTCGQEVKAPHRTSENTYVSKPACQYFNDFWIRWGVDCCSDSDAIRLRFKAIRIRCQRFGVFWSVIVCVWQRFERHHLPLI